jgi:hypothetical protein
MCKAPEFVQVIPTPDQQIRLELKGKTGTSVRIEVSADLINWTPVITLPNPTGALKFNVPVASTLSRRFYRAVAR